MANFDWVKQPHGITKIVILLLTTTSLGLLLKYGWGAGSLEGANFTVVIIASNVFVIFYFILAKIVDDVSEKMSTTILVYDVAHAIFNIAIAGIGFKNTSSNYEEGIAGLVFVLLSAVAMLVDAFFEYKRRK